MARIPKLDNEAEKHLALLGSAESTAVSEAGIFADYSIGGLFKAAKAGEFDLRITADGRGTPAEPLSLRIVEKTKPISVLVLHADHFEFSGDTYSESARDELSRKPPGTLLAREGDLIEIGLWSARTKPGQKVAPAEIKLEQLPFKWRQWPFGYVPATD